MDVLERIRGGVIVSCQARPGNPFHGPEHMARMAQAAAIGGAVGIRANGLEDIRAIKVAVDLPVIGIWKIETEGFEIYITPTLESVLAVAEAGAEIVALDATPRPRPDGRTLAETIREAKARTKALLMADCSTFEEGLAAREAGADIVSTTLSGYTPYSPRLDGPDLEMIARLAKVLDIPVIGEGRFWEPEEVRRALDLGAHAVVIGTAITRPDAITARFVQACKRGRESKEG